MPFTRPTWPESARTAVLLTFDNFGESLDLIRFGHAGGASADGVYAPRRGVERILDLLDGHRLPCTFFVEGWNAARYAPLAREIVARGHEMGVHGWMHEAWEKLDVDRERALIHRATDTVAQVLGQKPKGWRSPGGETTPATLRLVHEAGYLYDSSFGDDDIPYAIKVAADGEATLVELPWSWSLDDAIFYGHAPRIAHPADVTRLWIDEFDAAHEMTGFFHLLCHPRFTGRPPRVRALHVLLDHVLGHTGLWFARCDTLAEHVATLSATPRYDAPAVAEA